MSTSNSRAAATLSRDSGTDTKSHESSPHRQTGAWLAVLLHWHLRGFVGRATAWVLKAGALLRGNSNIELLKTAVGPIKSPRSPNSSRSPKSCSCARRRWCREASSLLTKSIFSESASVVTVQKPLLPAEDKSKGCPKNVSKDIAPVAPVDFQPQSSFSDKEEVQKRPMLPMEALHRIVSPAARSVAAEVLPDFSIPTTPKLLLPEAAFARVPVITAEPDTLISVQRSKRKKTTRVSFLENAEWVLFDLDQPLSQPEVKSRPTSFFDEESPRSPRPFQIKSGTLSFHGQPSMCDESVGIEAGKTMHKSNGATLKEAMLSIATPKARTSDPYALGCCDASNEEATHDVELTVATPKAGLPRQYTLQGLPTFGHGSSGKSTFGSCTTPKAGSSSSARSGFFDEQQSDIEDCKTPKAGSSSPAQFGFCESLPADFGDVSQSDSEPASPSLHNECEVQVGGKSFFARQETPSTASSSCQSGDLNEPPQVFTKSGHINSPNSAFIAVNIW